MLGGLLQYVDRCKVIDFYKILDIDYQGYIIDINLQEYFKVQKFQINQNDSSKLSSRRLIHCIRFKEKVKELIEAFNLQETMEKYCHIQALLD